MNKKDCLALINQLVDKTLSFGCEIEFYNEFVPKENVFLPKGRAKYCGCDLMEGTTVIVNNATVSILESKKFKTLGHDVMLGDVLSLINKNRKTLGDEKMYNSEMITVDLWRMCVTEKEWIAGETGYTKSMQCLLEEMSQRSRETNIKALFEFLGGVFLTKKQP